MLEKQAEKIAAPISATTRSSSSTRIAAFQGPSTKDEWPNAAYFIKHHKLTKAQTEALMEVRERIRDVEHPHNRPGAVIRYMRSRKFDVEKSEFMIRDLVAWRIRNRVDHILTEYEPPRLIADMYPGAILKGTDLAGDPIFVSRTGVTDLPGLLAKFGQDELIKYEIYRREAVMEGDWVKEWEREAGRPIQSSIVVEDLQGLSRRLLASSVRTFYGFVTEMDTRYYPESNKKIIIIRAPGVFRFVWAVGKKFYDPKVVNKMEFCGADNYLSVLSRYVDLDVLPRCINPEGSGEARAGSRNFDGGDVNSV